jgi:hypothetical protein
MLHPQMLSHEQLQSSHQFGAIPHHNCAAESFLCIFDLVIRHGSESRRCFDVMA